MEWVCGNPADMSAFYLGIILILFGGAVKVLWDHRVATGLALALMISGDLIVSESKAEATVPIDCEFLNKYKFPCIMIWLHFCACTWDDEPASVPSAFSVNSDPPVVW